MRAGESKAHTTMAIEVRNVEMPTHELFTPSGESMGFINELQFMDIRVQIRTEKIDGYHVAFGDQLVFIDKNGRLRDWPENFFDAYERCLDALLG